MSVMTGKEKEDTKSKITIFVKPTEGKTFTIECMASSEIISQYVSNC